MTKTNSFVFTFVQIMAWVIFVGLCIEAGALIFNFALGLINPNVMKNLYQGLDLSELYQRSKIAYFLTCSFMLCVPLLKVVLFYEVIKLVTKIDLARPFSIFVSDQIFQISYYTFSIGVVSFIARQSVKRLMLYDIDVSSLNHFWEESQGFILMAGVIYIIAIIFKKGLEIQNENDLTV